MIFFDSLLSSLFKSQNTSNLIIEIGTHFELQRNPLQQVIVSQRILDKEMDYVMWGYSIPSPSPFLSLPHTTPTGFFCQDVDLAAKVWE